MQTPITYLLLLNLNCTEHNVFSKLKTRNTIIETNNIALIKLFAKYTLAQIRTRPRRILHTHVTAGTKSPIHIADRAGKKNENILPVGPSPRERVVRTVNLLSILAYVTVEVRMSAGKT